MHIVQKDQGPEFPDPKTLLPAVFVLSVWLAYIKFCKIAFTPQTHLHLKCALTAGWLVVVGRVVAGITTTRDPIACPANGQRKCPTHTMHSGWKINFNRLEIVLKIVNFFQICAPLYIISEDMNYFRTLKCVAAKKNPQMWYNIPLFICLSQ